ncbi:MAG: glycoside hydrolase family 1 protein [Ignavibacteriaceae bacterium]
MFLWGSSTSAFQIEGDINNDFTSWERGGNFSTGSYQNYNNGINHWEMWREDFDLLKEMGHNAYRFSIEWSRIQPFPGVYLEEPLRQYEEMIDYLLSLGIEPLLTLHHFTHPEWFHEYSPWDKIESVTAFTNFARKIIERFSGKVRYWISFNEPVVWALGAYGDAKFPPGIKDLTKMMRVIENILTAHSLVYDILKSYREDAQLGIAKHFTVFRESRSWFFPDRKIRDLIHYFFNVMLLEAFRENRLQINFPQMVKYDSKIKLDNKIDFWGINYYYRLHTKFRLSFKNPFQLYHQNPATDSGWEIYPKGLKKIIRHVAGYGKDIIITENGIATLDEEQRKKFLRKHLRVIRRQKEKGIKLKGYFYWSLLDNYEWLHGYSKKFGLVSVDHNDGYRREVKAGGLYYAKLIKKYTINDFKKNKTKET